MSLLRRERAARTARRVSTIVALTLLSACAPIVYALPIGAPRAPLPVPCGVHVERLAPADAAQKYVQVGQLCVSLWGQTSPDIAAIEADEEARALLEHRACGLGGNVLIPVGFCTTGSGRASSPAVELAVFAERSPASASPAP